jgi:hypothetical protein
MPNNLQRPFVRSQVKRGMLMSTDAYNELVSSHAVRQTSPLDLAPIPRSGVDAHGRLLPISAEERERRAEAFAQTIDLFPAEGESEEVWADVMKSIDAGRPYRKLFEGQY